MQSHGCFVDGILQQSLSMAFKTLFLYYHPHRLHCCPDFLCQSMKQEGQSIHWQKAQVLSNQVTVLTQTVLKEAHGVF